MWPPKPEILIYLELWQIGWQFKRQIRGFLLRPAQRSFTRAIATTTDNRKWQRKRFARQSCSFWWSIVVAIIWLIFFCQAGHHRKSGIWRWNFDSICQSSTDGIISGFGGHVDISGCRPLLYLLAETIFPLYVVLYSTFVVGILTVFFHSFRDTSISVSAAVSDSRSLLESPRYTSCEFAMVECRKFVVGMLMVYVCHSFVDISTSG